MKNFSYFAPKTIDELRSILSKFAEGTFLMAGGTDLMVHMKSKEIVPKCVVDLKRLGLNYIKDSGKEVTIGATTTLHDLESSELIKKRFPVLTSTCSDMASPSIRNLGTIGGNLCNAAPSADLVPPLITLKSRVKINGPDGQRVIPVEEMFVGPGETVLKRGEVLMEIQIPDLPPQAGAVYLKQKRNEGMDLAVVGVAACLIRDGSGKTCQEARIALGAVAPTPIRALKAEEVLRGKPLSEDLFEKAALKAKEAARPLDDVRGSAEYRRALVQVLTRDALRRAHELVSSGRP